MWTAVPAYRANPRQHWSLVWFSFTQRRLSYSKNWRWPHEKLSLFHIVPRDRKHVIQNAIGFNELKWQTELAQGLLPLGSWSSACDAGLTCGFTSRTVSEIQCGSKHHRVEARCAQKWQIQWYGTFNNIRIFHSMPAYRKVATCNMTCAAPCADSQDTNTWTLNLCLGKLKAWNAVKPRRTGSQCKMQRNVPCNCHVDGNVIA